MTVDSTVSHLKLAPSLWTASRAKRTLPRTTTWCRPRRTSQDKLFLAFIKTCTLIHTMYDRVPTRESLLQKCLGSTWHRKGYLFTIKHKTILIQQQRLRSQFDRGKIWVELKVPCARHNEVQITIVKAILEKVSEISLLTFSWAGHNRLFSVRLEELVKIAN